MKKPFLLFESVGFSRFLELSDEIIFETFCFVFTEVGELLLEKSLLIDVEIEKSLFSLRGEEFCMVLIDCY